MTDHKQMLLLKVSELTTVHLYIPKMCTIPEMVSAPYNTLVSLLCVNEWCVAIAPTHKGGRIL